MAADKTTKMPSPELKTGKGAAGTASKTPEASTDAGMAKEANRTTGKTAATAKTAEKPAKNKKSRSRTDDVEASIARRQKLNKNMLCDGLSFAAAEAYKLLRTNLLFSLPEKDCRVIGVTSSIRGEGKSTTSVNLSYTLAQSGKKVLLIDADMRLPSIAVKLGMHNTPGLSNLLAGLRSERSCMRTSGYFDNWFILPAGDIPPNPSELLGSERMHALLERYSEVFDFIVIDLPPVNIVADALVLSPWTDGLISVVRQNYTERKAVEAAMYQIGKVGAKLLGFVMTDAAVGSSSYKNYGKYGKYGYSGYGYGYESSSRSDRTKDKAFLDAALDDFVPEKEDFRDPGIGEAEDPDAG